MIETIGIIGGIGSGKSLVAHAMQKQGGYLISADLLGHEALTLPSIRDQLVQRWGNRILKPDGDLDRSAIAKIVFVDPAELRELEALVFPYIEKRIREEMVMARQQSHYRFIILDAAIMLETGWHKNCNKIIFIDAPRSLRLARLQANRGWNDQELSRRENTQMPLEKKKEHAHATLMNDADLEKVRQQVQDILEQWHLIC